MTVEHEKEFVQIIVKYSALITTLSKLSECGDYLNQYLMLKKYISEGVFNNKVVIKP